MDQAAILAEVAEAIRQTFRRPNAVISRETTALDIDGWDSLSHTGLMLDLEERFGMEFPPERMFDLADVGELVDLIQAVKSGNG